MNIPAKVDYALRALLEMAALGAPVSGERLAEAQGIPTKFLSAILNDLRRAGLVSSQRGTDGGYWLARPPDQICPADVIRALDGPIAAVRGVAPEETAYHGAATHLTEVWIAARASLRRVLEEVTLADIVAGRFQPGIDGLIHDHDAWAPEQGPYRPRLRPGHDVGPALAAPPHHAGQPVDL